MDEIENCARSYQCNKDGDCGSLESAGNEVAFSARPQHKETTVCSARFFCMNGAIKS
jgi:hypothetical protein